MEECYLPLWPVCNYFTSSVIQTLNWIILGAVAQVLHSVLVRQHRFCRVAALMHFCQPASHVMPHCMTTKACPIWLKALINRERIKKWKRRKSHSCLSAVHDKQRRWSAACAQQDNYQQQQLILLDKCQGISCMSGQGRRKCLTCVHEIILQT